MTKQKTDKRFNVYEGTKGVELTSKSYKEGDSYVSQKGHRITGELSSSSRYVSASASVHVSSGSSRAYDKTTEINKKLKKLSR